MAPIVYDGVAGNGDLFAGKKIFIAQRVPMRNSLTRNVESNGGEIVPLERQADIVIADHARPKYAPEGAISWRYIEQSVQNGVLEDPETHIIHAAQSANNTPASRTPGRIVGGSRPSRRTRTPFTNADDEELRRWVAKGHQLGMAVLGNKLYQQLEAHNPRHTAQSWQDRYKKQFRDKPHPKVSNDPGPGPVMEVVRGQPSRPLARHQLDEADGSQDDAEDRDGGAHTRAHGGHEIARRAVSPIVKGEEFTETDHNLLVSEYEYILQIESRESSLIDEAWSAFENAHGRHTAEEWYAYFCQVVKPCMEKKLAKTSKVGKSKSEVIPIEGDDQESQEEDGMTDLHGEPLQLVADEIPASVLLRRSPSVSSAAQDSVVARKPSFSHEASDALSRKIRDDAVSEDKAAFLEDLRTIARVTHKQIEPIQEVCGTRVHLYDLWSIVNGRFKSFQKVDSSDLWHKVATAIGFDIKQKPEAANSLRTLYTTFLVKVGSLQACASTSAAKTDPPVPEQRKAVPLAAVVMPAVTSSSLPTPPKTAQQHSAPVSKVREAGALPVSQSQTYKATQQKKGAGADPFSSRGSASNKTKSLPVKAVPGVLLTIDARGEPGQTKSHDAAKFKPSPIQPKTMGESLDSRMQSESDRAYQEELTAADKKMLGRLVTFTKEYLGKDITSTGKTVCGRWVPFPSFQKAVNEFGGYDKVTDKELWKRVAYRLGYDPVARYIGVAEELRKCYEEVLEDFDGFCADVKEEQARRASLGGQGSLKLADEDSGMGFVQTPAPQPGALSSRKHNRAVSGDEGPSKIFDTFKRLRVDRKGKGKEIPLEVPGTPEHIYNSSFASKEASVVKDSQAFVLVSDAESDETEPFRLINRPLFEKAAADSAPKPFLKPNALPSSPVFDGRPSQQTRSEAVAYVSPNLDRRKNFSQSSSSSEDEDKADSELKEYHAMCKGEGYTKEVATQALRYANMDKELAKNIWRRVAKGLAIPENIRGIWTSGDDRVLAQGLKEDDPSMVKLIRKHGSVEVEERLEFLEWLAGQEEDE